MQQLSCSNKQMVLMWLMMKRGEIMISILLSARSRTMQVLPAGWSVSSSNVCEISDRKGGHCARLSACACRLALVFVAEATNTYLIQSGYQSNTDFFHVTSMMGHSRSQVDRVHGAHFSRTTNLCSLILRRIWHCPYYKLSREVLLSCSLFSAVCTWFFAKDVTYLPLGWE